MTIEVFSLSQQDISAVIALGKKTAEFQTGTDSPDFYSPETLAAWAENPNGVSLVAKEKDELAGFILGQALSAIHPLYRNSRSVS